MKNLIKVFVAMRSIAIILVVAVIGFSMAACDDGSGGNDTPTTPTTYSIDGIWGDNYGTRITVNGKTGVFNALTSSPNALTQSAIDKGYIKIGDPYWQTITSTGTLTWSGQQKNIQYETSKPNIATGTVWRNCTFTMSANGQSLTVTGADTSGATLGTWTRQ